MTRHLTAAVVIAAVLPATAPASAADVASKALNKATAAQKTADKALDKVKELALKKGEKGPRGPKGAAGAAGAKGDQGAGGAKGETGPQGLPGPSGSTGGSGGKGAQGVAGPTGPTGVAGPTGVRGPTGTSGTSGPTGARGPTGPPGAGGAPESYFANLVSPTTLGTTYVEVAGFDLPPGDYLVFGSTSLVDFSAAKDGIGRCGIRLQTQEPTFEHSAVIGKDPATPDGEAVATVALQDAFSLPIAARVGLVCKTLVDLGTDATAENPTLSAIEVGTVNR